MKLTHKLIKNNWLPRNIPHGWGNGYVMLPQKHPCFKKDYMEIDVEVHGGLTYSQMEGDMWVVGFDTAHCYDNLARWPKKEVLAETLKLKKQLEEMV